MRQIFLQFNSK